MIAELMKGWLDLLEFCAGDLFDMEFALAAEVDDFFAGKKGPTGCACRYSF